MREAILQLLQQRMDKCTTEQVWAVAMFTGLDAFALHSSAAVAGPAPLAVVLHCGVAGVLWPIFASSGNTISSAPFAAASSASFFILSAFSSRLSHCGAN